MSTYAVREDAQKIPIRVFGEGRTVWYFHDEVSVAPGRAVEALAERFRVVAPIHPGFANSPRPSWVRHTEDIADLYLDRVNEEEGDELLLFGSSVGAWIAVELALLLGDRVAQLVLVGPIGLHVQNHPPADHWFATDADRDAILYHHAENKPEVEMEEYVANEAMFARVGWNPRMASKRLGPRLGRLTVPTAIIWGQEDALTPPEHVRAWQQHLPHARTIKIPEAGHYPVYEQPDVLSARVTEVLEAAPGVSLERRHQ